VACLSKWSSSSSTRSTAEAAVDEEAAEWFTEVGFLPLLFFELGQGAAAKHFVLQERYYRRLRARIISVELGTFGLCDHPRDVVFSVARAGGPGRLSSAAGRRLPVHSVPHNSLGDSIGPGTAKCISLEVLSVDGGLDFAGQGIPGLFVYGATCALFKAL